jgi:hypothetical protein
MDVETLIESRVESHGLSPGFEHAKLFFGHRTGAIFGRGTNDGLVSPKLRGECQLRLRHQSPFNTMELIYTYSQ